MVGIQAGHSSPSPLGILFSDQGPSRYFVRGQPWSNPGSVFRFVREVLEPMGGYRFLDSIAYPDWSLPRGHQYPAAGDR